MDYYASRTLGISRDARGAFLTMTTSQTILHNGVGDLCLIPKPRGTVQYCLDFLFWDARIFWAYTPWEEWWGFTRHQGLNIFKDARRLDHSLSIFKTTQPILRSNLSSRLIYNIDFLCSDIISLQSRPLFCDGRGFGIHHPYRRSK